MSLKLTHHEHWLLSFYRISEISGALFFGRLARTLRPGRIQSDLTKHFSDEAQHAYYWTRAMNELGVNPLKLRTAYQDQYLEAAGMPVNMLEILSLTLVFERRVIGQYGLHKQVPTINPVVRSTIERIMQDEKWHIQWVSQAIRDMRPEFGGDHIDKVMQKYLQADKEVYEKTITEHAECIDSVLGYDHRKIVNPLNDMRGERHA